VPEARRRPSWLPVLIATLLALGGVLSAEAPSPSFDAPLVVEVAPVPLSPGAPGRERVGSLAYRGGLWLRSSDRRFGGLSDLRVSADGTRLWAVSDCGFGLSATLSYDPGGRLAGFAEPQLIELRGPNGDRLSHDERDAESLVVDGESLEVGFERADRILSYPLVPPFAGASRRVPVPDALHECRSNGGLETMALIARGRHFLACEERKGQASDTPAWVETGDGWTERRYPLLFDGGWADEPFRPTSAARLPGGDMLVLERRFPPIGARVVRIAAEDLAVASAAVGKAPAFRTREVARFESPLTLDNFEGIEVRWDGRRTLVYLLSDDNNCAKRRHGRRGTGRQRTLLLMFALEE
jgi:hypothetical protein